MKQYRRSKNGTEIGRETMMRRDNTAKGAALGEAKGRAWNKLNNQKGFSLAETLLAVLILLLVSLIVANGMPAATNAYNKIVLGANARTMLSTAINALHDELGTAWQVENPTDPTDTTSITYFNASTGAKSKISLDENKHIVIQDYIALADNDLIHDSTSSTEGAQRELVSEAKAGGQQTMYATYSSIGYSDGIVTIKDLKILKVSDDPMALASFIGSDGQPCDFKIRVISNDYKAIG